MSAAIASTSPRWSARTATRMSISRRRATRRRSPTPRSCSPTGSASRAGSTAWSRRPAPRRRSSSPPRASSRARRRGTTTAMRHGDADPHAWQSVANAKIYVANIRDALIARRPGRQGQLRGECRRLSRPSSTRSTPEVKAAIAEDPGRPPQDHHHPRCLRLFRRRLRRRRSSRRRASRPRPRCRPRTSRGSSRRSGSRRSRRCSWRTSPTSACSSASARRAARASAARSIPTR